jgi:hypothetical protein
MYQKIKSYKNRVEYLDERDDLHREDGPARIWKDGSKAWFLNGYRHRMDGPAIEMNNGEKSWYLNDKRYSEEEWKTEVAKIKLYRILDL